MNLVLLRAGWTLAIIPPICRAEYIATLEKAGRSPADFVRFIRDRVCETQKELLRLMGEPIALDDEGVKSASDEGVNEGVNLLLSLIAMNPGSSVPSRISIGSTATSSTAQRRLSHGHASMSGEIASEE